MKFLLATTSAIALSSLPALAQDSFELDKIVVFANQTETAADRSGSIVEIVEQDALTETKRVADVLDTLPGVSISGNGGLGTSSTLRIRGLSTKYVPVFIDGIDMSDPSGTQNQFDFGGLLTNGLGRVEVLKGSQSAIYGSEAIGGVINITTARPTEMGMSGNAALEVGSFGTISTQLGVATKAERGELALTVSHVSTDGFSAADENDGNTEADPYRANTAILSGSFEATDTVKLGFTLYHQNSFLQIDAFGGAGGDADRPTFTDRNAGRIYAEIDGGAVQHTIAAAVTRTARADPLSAFTNNFVGERVELSYKGVTEVGAAKIAFGANYSDEEFNVDGTVGSTKNQSIFAEAQYAVNADMDLAFSLRHDDHSQFGGFTTGRLALAYRASDNTVLRASLGNGFRAPSLYELFGPFGLATLQPESSRSLELGVEHSYGTGASVKATAFYTEIDDLIGFAGASYNQVAGTSVTKGVELSGEYPIDDRFSVYGSYTYTDAKDRNGAQLRRVPEHDLVLGVNMQWTDQLSTQISLNHVAGRADDGFPAGPMADYTKIDASLSYDFSDTASAYMRIENLTDEEYQTSAGYSTSDRAVFFGVRASF